MLQDDLKAVRSAVKLGISAEEKKVDEPGTEEMIPSTNNNSFECALGEKRKKEGKTIWVKPSMRPILEDPLALINPFFLEKKKNALQFSRLRIERREIAQLLNLVRTRFLGLARGHCTFELHRISLH